MDKISDIQIGYTVSQNSTASLVIDLTPTYFVKYNNVWINYQDLISGKKWGDNANEF
ncbi:two-component system activity regulator YycH [uncultured Ligilactobacillus sp.]|uniref:two-component system activity regulator YycH n=1 Tax=uncultured Ligilactobacillus sp. TaxID=2837633 RepID=UPI00272C2742|nr:two-component system activity regulator YycH [uncultured Ligilactobacillus sp.]